MEDSKNINIQNDFFVECVIKLVSAYISNQKIEKNEISEIVSICSKSVQELNKINKKELAENKLIPAVKISESIMPDYIVCLEDGKKLKMLKRHLSTVYKMTIEEYRERWGLPQNYPVVAPNYAKTRSSIAKKTGLGKFKNDFSIIKEGNKTGILKKYA